MSEQIPKGWKNLTWTVARIAIRPALFLAAGLLLILGLAAAQRMGWISAGGNSGAAHQSGTQKEDVRYICPMMCTPPLKEPGRCPVCAMELVPVSGSDGRGDGLSIQIDPASRRVANIRTVAVKSVAAMREIRAVGGLSYDEGKLKTLAAYVDGRLDRLYADYTGVVVSQGDELALLYSPQLYTAQTELLAATRIVAPRRAFDDSRPFDSQDLVRSARQKLIDLGMTEQQVDLLEEEKRPSTRITLVAPIHGTVVDRLASEGDYVKTGQPIYRLADLSTLWLMLELFPEDAASVRYGQRVTARVPSLPGEEVAGRVAFVDPVVNPKTRTVGVRVVVPNDRHLLKVGDYATAIVKVPLASSEDSQTAIYDPDLAGKWISPRHPHVVADAPGKCSVCGIELVPASSFGFADAPIAGREQLVVPRNAVLMAGSNSVVYVETDPGRFELRRVKLGPSLGGEIVVLSGVQEGEQVATSGNFLIDSQMQLAGNPSLIDPNKAQPAPPLDDALAPQVVAALAELSDADRALAQTQRICPVTEMLLGSMGVPRKVDVAGRTVFVCCEGCREPLLAEPDKYLSVLDGRAAQDATSGIALPGGLPPIGPVEMIGPGEADSGNEAMPSMDLPPIGPIEVLEPGGKEVQE